MLAVAAGWMAPTYLIVAGTPSVDPICGTLVLMALAAVLARQTSLTAWLLGGAALGLAVAIKPTNLALGLAIGGVIALRWYLGQARWTAVAGFTTATLALVLLGAGFWSTWLWTTFENPVFPLFNHIFNSPYAPDGPTVAGRFLPRSTLDYLSRPFEMAEFRSYTSTEGFAPDLRFAIALGFATLALAMSLVRQRWASLTGLSVWPRPDVQVVLFALVTYLLWMATSGNSRYAIALFLVIGLLMVRAVDLLVPQRLLALTVGSIMALQFAYYAGDGDRRYFAGPWDSRPYFKVQAAERLVREPFLHLSVGAQSFAAVAPYLHPAGALVNAVGQSSLPMEGKLGDKLRERLKRWEGKTRFLFHKSPKLDSAGTAQAVRTKLDYLTYRLRLQVDWTDCEQIVIDSDAATDGGRTLPRDTTNISTALLSCHAITRTDVNSTLDGELIRADKVFSLMEARCPKVFGPAPLATDIGENIFQRRYANHDVRVSVSPSEGVTLTHFRSLNAISLGNIDHVIKNGGQDACIAWQKLNAR